MKTNLLFIVLCSTVFFCFRSTVERPYCLEIKGRVISSSVDKNTTYKAILIRDSMIVDSLELPEKQAFKFDLKRKEHYRIRIKKEGFLDRFIVIETNIDDNKYANDHFKFMFDIDLVDAEDFEGISQEYFQPVYIHFNNNKGWFSYNDLAVNKQNTYGFATDILNVFQCK